MVRNSHFTTTLGAFFLIRMYRGIGIFTKWHQIAVNISRERSAILTNGKKRWNHARQYFKICLTCFLTPKKVEKGRTSPLALILLKRLKNEVFPLSFRLVQRSCLIFGTKVNLDNTYTLEILKSFGKILIPCNPLNLLKNQKFN